MNDLQHIPQAKYGPVLVTLNAPFEPAADKIAGRWKYDHPVLDTKVRSPSTTFPHPAPNILLTHRTS